MSKSESMKKNNDGKVYTLYYAFFLIPLMVTILGVMFFFTFKVLTYETNSPIDYLSDVQYGAATKRWQAAFELSKLLSDPDLPSLNKGFHTRMISVYEQSIHDDPSVRMYLALAMGRTKNSIYGEALIGGLKDKDEASRVAAIKALGNMSYKPAIQKLNGFTHKHNSVQERLSATIALGNMADDSVVSTLVGLLDDEEPNIRWDSAIALAKLENSSGAKIIENLLDRMYYDQFKEVDSDEEVQAILIAIQASDKIPSEKFIDNLLKLATFDHNMKIRNSAIKSLNKTYNRKI
ncbi:MAG: HEAT repeat domain-containing protein [Candidatus Neomarinimicrobiota bacterium]|nr:HEAT repeat domain-containing protein [Candidatus Neomarinimicrobiota bacterium]|tara:strand:+ start:374 stop:1249 length:876 start_codon:yes stop_codon:yes gene_type:complete